MEGYDGYPKVSVEFYLKPCNTYTTCETRKHRCNSGTTVRHTNLVKRLPVENNMFNNTMSYVEYVNINNVGEYVLGQCSTKCKFDKIFLL